MATTIGSQPETSVLMSPGSGGPSARRTSGELARVAVVSDQRLVRDSIKIALRNRGFAATSYNAPVGSTELADLARRVRRFGAVVGLLVCDLDDPRQLRESTAVVGAVRLRWLVLTGAHIGPGWGAMVQAGVAGVLPMSTGLDQLAHAVKTVLAGNSPMRSSVRMRVLQQWQTQVLELGRLAECMATLTPRETEILERLRDGEPVKAIAEAAGVTEGTVRSQVKSILRKLGVSSQLAAVAAYRRLSDGSVTTPSES